MQSVKTNTSATIPTISVLSLVLFNYLVRKKFYIQEGLEGASSIIDVGGLIYYDKKMNCVYYGTALKLTLHLCTCWEYAKTIAYSLVNH